MTEKIPFLEITGVDENVCCIAGHMHVYDLIKVMCNTQKAPREDEETYEKRVYNKNYNLWKRFNKAAAVAHHVKKHNFHCGGKGNTPVISLEGAKKLIGWLPDKVYNEDKVLALLAKNLLSAAPVAASTSAPVTAGTAAPVAVVTEDVEAGTEDADEVAATVIMPTPLQMQVVSFDEFKLGFTVRVLLEQPPLIHANDLVMVVTGKKQKHAPECISRIKKDIFDTSRILRERTLKVPSGTKTIKFVTYEDAMQLVFALGGREANKMKFHFAKILTRYFAGDATMHEELNVNATSSSAIHALAREALLPPLVGAGDEVVRQTSESPLVGAGDEVIRKTSKALDAVVTVS